ncbi:Clavaminate synthase-like protein [Amylocystis lapponica]|nr:Clavaminate synthase-like protein [Amylocystis lapponica]
MVRKYSKKQFSSSYNVGANVVPTCAVPLAEVPVASAPEAFLSFASSPESTPLFFPARHRSSDHTASRAQNLLRAFRNRDPVVVDIEVGRYDDTSPGAFDRAPMQLGQYLDWLEDTMRNDGTVGGKQLYLAQWRAGDEVPELAHLVKPPPPLGPLITDERVDLYHTSFFIGPNKAVTPLHYDPYLNLYHLHASSKPSTHAKHFTLIPPSVSDFIRRSDAYSTLRNTSDIDLTLRPASNSSHSEGVFDVLIDPATPARAAEAIAASALSCVLREGETLFIPRGWWHRVENVVLAGGTQSADNHAGWTAGVGWWFLPRRSRV